MPASLFPDMERASNGLEDQRALQLAFELSMLGLSELPAQNETPDPLGTTFPDEGRGKKSQNMTECVPVPSSEHVAEIVGRQGCKIKALRAKTNTYIKTPVRGEEPVFVVTGRKEDVAKAKREILSAAEHFSQIRASRKNTLNGAVAPGPPTNIPGQVTIQVRVPYRVVGLVVGPKGATIKRIQHQTHTYIVTPSRDKEPVFEVTGLPESVEAAKKEIEAHIAMRTGGGLLDGQDDSGGLVDFTNHAATSGDILNSLYKSGLNGINSLNNLNTLNSLTTGLNGSLGARITNGYGNSGGTINGFGGLMESQSHFQSYLDSNNIIPTGGSTGRTSQQDSTDIYSSFSSPSTSASSSVGGSTTKIADLVGFGGTIWNSLDRDEGIGESPSFETTVAPSTIWSDFKPLGSLSVSTMATATTTNTSVSSGSVSFPRRSSSVIGTSSGARFSPTLDLTVSSPHPPARRISSDPLCSSTGHISPIHSGGAVSPTSISPTESIGSLASSGAASLGAKRDCVVCGEREVIAALVPCGHNLFCMDCANTVCGKSEPECPACHQPVGQAIRIFS